MADIVETGKTGMGGWPKNILHLLAKRLHRLKNLC